MGCKLEMIAVVIPTYRASKSILAVLEGIPSQVGCIYVIDDQCPESSGKIVEAKSLDPRVRVIYHPKNTGVGGAMITGFAAAIRDGAAIVVKIDSDGQMDSRLLPWLVKPLVEGRADFSKGNRFFDLEVLGRMPFARLLGNAGLSFINKMSSGYWNVMDPTNGFIAIHARVLKFIPYQRLDRGYFFESDLLFRLGTVRAKVIDIPMRAKYVVGGVSSMNLPRILLAFPPKFLVRVFKRIAYSYFLRDFNVGSLAFLGAVITLPSGVVFGAWSWVIADQAGKLASSGTVMIAGLLIMVGVLSTLVFLIIDAVSTPRSPIHMDLPDYLVD